MFAGFEDRLVQMPSTEVDLAVLPPVRPNLLAALPQLTATQKIAATTRSALTMHLSR